MAVLEIAWFYMVLHAILLLLIKLNHPWSELVSLPSLAFPYYHENQMKKKQQKTYHHHNQPEPPGFDNTCFGIRFVGFGTWGHRWCDACSNI